MKKLKFPWDQLSDADGLECTRDLLLYGCALVRLRADGEGYERVPPIRLEADTEKAPDDAKPWWDA